MPHHKRKWHITLAAALLIFGILISAQIQTQNRLEVDLSSQNSSDLIIMINNLSEKRRSLTTEISTSEAMLYSYRNDYSDNTQLLENVSAETTRMEMVIGNTTIYGSGITVEMTKDMYPLYTDILDIVNELWASGAEAVAINDYRLNDRSYLYYSEDDTGTVMTLNGNALEFPIVISAIGNSDTMESSLNMPGGIINNLNLFHVYPIITKQDKVIIPLLEEPANFKYAEVSKSN